MIKATEAKKRLINIFKNNDWQQISYENCIIAKELEISSMKIYEIYFGKLGYLRTCIIAGKKYYKATEKLEKHGKIK